MYFNVIKVDSLTKICFLNKIYFNGPNHKYVRDENQLNPNILNYFYFFIKVQLSKETHKNLRHIFE